RLLPGAWVAGPTRSVGVVGPRPVCGGLPGLPRSANRQELWAEPSCRHGHSLWAVSYAGGPSRFQVARRRWQVRGMSPTPVPADVGEPAFRHAGPAGTE